MIKHSPAAKLTMERKFCASETLHNTGAMSVVVHPLEKEFLAGGAKTTLPNDYRRHDTKVVNLSDI